MIFSNAKDCCGVVVAFGPTWFAVGTRFGETLSARPLLTFTHLSPVGEAPWNCEVDTDLALALIDSSLLIGRLVRLGSLAREKGTFVFEAAPLSLLGVGYFGPSIWRAV